MPWSPTQAFPHPLANVQSSNTDQSITNFMSYALVEMMTWQGLGDIINRFREKSLELEPVSLMWAPGMASRLRIPYTYCWYEYSFKLLCTVIVDERALLILMQVSCPDLQTQRLGQSHLGFRFLLSISR